MHKPDFDYRIFLAAILGVTFGLLLNVLLPVFARNPLFLLALPAAGAFFLFLVMRPKETLVIILLARPLLDVVLDLTKISVGGTQFSAGAALNLAVIALGIFTAFYYKGFPKRDPMVKWWIIYLLVLLCAAAYSPFKGTAARLLVNQATYFTMFLIPFFMIKDRKDFLFWLKILVISFILPVGVANIDMLVWGGRYFADTGQRITGSFAHPNILSFYMVLGFTIYFFVLKSGYFTLTRVQRNFMVALMANMLVILIATKTRNAWIAFFGGFFIYGLLRDRKTLVILLIVSMLSMFVPAVQQRLLSVFQPPRAGEYKGINSFEWRIEMWKSALPRIAQKPLQGHGLTSFKPLSREFSTVGANGAHNVYLELLFEAGIFGMLSFMVLIFTPCRIFLKTMWRSGTGKESQLLAILVGYTLSYILICTSDNLLFYLALNWYVWFFLGMMVVAVKFNLIGQNER
jgi:O-antigen ligase